MNIDIEKILIYNKPFRHYIINNVFDINLIKKFLLEFPDYNDNIWEKHGRIISNEHTKKKDISNMKIIPFNIKKIFNFFLSDYFTEILENITGLENLIPDKNLSFGGMTITPNGGKLENHIDFNMDIGHAVESRRFHHQWLPPYIQIEQFSLSNDVINNLQAKGHDLVYRSKFGIGEANCILMKNNFMYGAADSRRGAHALGY